jgi:hypothetical protein
MNFIDRPLWPVAGRVALAPESSSVWLTTRTWRKRRNLWIGWTSSRYFCIAPPVSTKHSSGYYQIDPGYHYYTPCVVVCLSYMYVTAYTAHRHLRESCSRPSIKSDERTCLISLIYRWKHSPNSRKCSSILNDSIYYVLHQTKGASSIPRLLSVLNFMHGVCRYIFFYEKYM